jgi:hypothetical protein
MTRWSKEEEIALAEIKVRLKTELANAPQFPGSSNSKAVKKIPINQMITFYRVYNPKKSISYPNCP